MRRGTRRLIRQLNQKQREVLWIIPVILLVVFAISWTLAAYTGINSVKRVVSTHGSGGVLFTSNYLVSVSRDAETASVKRITYSGTSDPSIFVSVCNYEQGNRTAVHDTPILYNITVTLVDKSGNPITEEMPEDFPQKDTEGNDLDLTDWVSSYSVTWKKPTGGPVLQPFTLGTEGYQVVFENVTLPAGIPYADYYQITLNGKLLEYVGVKVEALPTDTALPKLGRVLYASIQTVTQKAQWNGIFTDDTNIPSKEYDGFNYRIYGVGAGEFTLSWDTRFVDIGKWDLEKLAVLPTETDGVKTITLPVNSADVSEYSIRFYRTQNACEDETWKQDSATAIDYVVGDGRSYVTSSFVADEEE